jgi:hypothetical protein
MTELFKSPVINKNDLFQSHKVKRSGLASYTNTISKKGAYNKLIKKGDNIQKLINDRTAIMNILDRNKDKPRYRSTYPMRYSQLEAEVAVLKEKQLRDKRDQAEALSYINANTGNMVPADALKSVVSGGRRSVDKRLDVPPEWIKYGANAVPPLVSPKQVPEEEPATIPEVSFTPLYRPVNPGGEASGKLPSVSTGAPPFKPPETQITPEEETAQSIPEPAPEPAPQPTPDWIDELLPNTEEWAKQEIKKGLKLKRVGVYDTLQSLRKMGQIDQSQYKYILSLAKQVIPNEYNIPEHPDSEPEPEPEPVKKKRERKRATIQVPAPPPPTEESDFEREKKLPKSQFVDMTAISNILRKSELPPKDQSTLKRMIQVERDRAGIESDLKAYTNDGLTIKEVNAILQILYQAEKGAGNISDVSSHESEPEGISKKNMKWLAKHGRFSSSESESPDYVNYPEMRPHTGSGSELSEGTARRKAERLAEARGTMGDINVRNLKKGEKKITK